MRHLFFLTNFLIISIIVFGQDNDEIPKGVNKIIVNTGLTEQENLKIIIGKLRKEEYSIQRVDSISYQIQTSPKKFKSSSYTYTFHFNIFEGKFNVSSFYNSNTGVQIMGLVFNDSGQELITTKNKNSFQNKVFREMKGIVLDLFDSSRIEYNFSKK